MSDVSLGWPYVHLGKQVIERLGKTTSFLFAGTCIISCTIFLQVLHFKVPETPNFREFNVLDFPGITMNGFVEVDNFGV